MPLATSQDHKRVLDGDRGPNTGGMGVYSPVPILRDGELERMVEIEQRVVDQLREDGMAEFIAIVNRILGLTKESDKVSNFKDVKKNAWYRSEVAKALEAGYITGISADMMGPLKTITNE